MAAGKSSWRCWAGRTSLRCGVEGACPCLINASKNQCFREGKVLTNALSHLVGNSVCSTNECYYYAYWVVCTWSLCSAPVPLEVLGLKGCNFPLPLFLPKAKASGKKLQKVTLKVSPRGIVLNDSGTNELIENVSIYRWVTACAAVGACSEAAPASAWAAPTSRWPSCLGRKQRRGKEGGC